MADTDDEGEVQSDPQAIEVSVLLAELQEACGGADVESVDRGLEAVELEISVRGEEAAREFLAAHGVPITMRTLQAFGAEPQILKRCCHLLFWPSQTSSLRASPVLSAASVAALRFAMNITPLHDVDRQVDQAEGLSWALRTVHNCVPGLSTELREKALAANAVEWLLIGCRSQFASIGCMEGLLILCGIPNETHDGCVRRLIARGGSDMILRGLKRCVDVEGGWDKSVFDEVTAAGWLLSAMHSLVARTPDEALISTFESNEAHMLSLLLDVAKRGLKNDRVDVYWIEMVASTLSGFSRTVRNKRCSQQHARVATDAIVTLLLALIVEVKKPPSIACACTVALKAFAGGCGGGDATATGAYALRAGALEALETPLQKAEVKDDDSAWLSRPRWWCGSASDAELGDSTAAVSAFVDSLRELDAHKSKLVAKAEDLWAESEVQGMQRAMATDRRACSVAEAVALANELTEFYCDGQVVKALLFLSTILPDHMPAAVEVGAVAMIVKAVRELGKWNTTVLTKGCWLLYHSYARLHHASWRHQLLHCRFCSIC